MRPKVLEKAHERVEDLIVSYPPLVVQYAKRGLSLRLGKVLKVFTLWKGIF
ncbi:hypothetical protein JGUZn3_13980 [Entomobacter blattae]|uniref:Uncharacterized protein n=1 Tax=Entomobacter blattae TaxID=2762277 RepID=A0A7H1NS63_9PROT|nr:hypothetical protein JGUZn3_13980 [Entomobacter blattae]